MDESIQISSNTEKDITKKNIMIENSFANLTLSDIGTNEKRDEVNTINSISSNNKFDDLNNIFQKSKRTKLRKEDLNNIPLPIFSCIYCSNEKVSFNHMIKEILENKYYLLTSKYDIITINKILMNNNVQNLIIDNKEYFKKYYKYKESKKFLNIYTKAKTKNFNLHNNNINIIYSTNKSTCSNSINTKFKLEEILKEQKQRKNIKIYDKRKIKKKDIKWEPKYYNISNS